MSYNSIAGNYEEILEEDKALDFYKKAVVYSEKASNDTLKNWFYNNIGNIYLYRKNNVDVGIEYYNKSLEFSNRLKDTASTVLTKLNLSWAYFQKKDYTKAIQNLDFAEKHIDYMRFPDTETYLNLLLGMKFNHLKDNEKAKLYYEKAIAISTKIN
ncbi:tetratricopeptide repeat protein [Flavobacterium piscinae]|uniref:tetratricopeptide repeat protein n=1 Tax=Flavobacterium piscinae TaxID=2506424 RepID=UPI00199774CC|nr:tetratricopeptide repeat protein [Flavobacterium piscinae]MBC8882533.1 tetratricopeptide repeat protein [Flavobacterium piscinae]